MRARATPIHTAFGQFSDLTVTDEPEIEGKLIRYNPNAPLTQIGEQTRDHARKRGSVARFQPGRIKWGARLLSIAKACAKAIAKDFDRWEGFRLARLAGPPGGRYYLLRWRPKKRWPEAAPARGCLGGDTERSWGRRLKSARVVHVNWFHHLSSSDIGTSSDLPVVLLMGSSLSDGSKL